MGLIAVGDDEESARLAVPGADDRGLAVPLGTRLCRDQFLAERDPPLREQRGAAGDHRPAFDDALDAEAFPVAKALRGRQLGARCRCDRARNGVLGRTLECAHQPQRLGRGRRPQRGTTSTSAIFPVVTVPVLSSTIVSTRRVDSSTSGPLIRIPSWAPRPVPTSSAVGVASPRAHGQAMISTATAAANANEAPLPAPSQNTSVATARTITIGTKMPEIAVGQPLHRRLARLRLRDETSDLRERGVGTDT